MAMKKFAPIGLNAEGKEVEEIVKLLAKAGSSVKPTKKYTIGVRSAVLSFQKKNKLPATGIVDGKTWMALQAFKLLRKPRKK